MDDIPDAQLFDTKFCDNPNGHVADCEFYNCDRCGKYTCTSYRDPHCNFNYAKDPLEDYDEKILCKNCGLFYICHKKLLELQAENSQLIAKIKELQAQAGLGLLDSKRAALF